MFSECMSFLIRENGVTVVGSAEDADVRLAGDDVLPRHAVINFGPGALQLYRGAVGLPMLYQDRRCLLLFSHKA